MSARKPRNLAEALAASPTMRVELEPAFVVELAAMEHVGVDDWATWMVQRAQLASIGTSARSVHLSSPTGGDTYWLHKSGDRAKLTTAYRKRARWALKLGLSATRALDYVPADERAATAALMASEVEAARAAVDKWGQAAAERDREQAA
jgi:hypothetical protein